MPSIKRLVAPMMIAFAILCSLSFMKGEDTREQGHLCNLKVNADDSNEEVDLSILLSPLIEETQNHGYSQHLNRNGYYGVAACNGQISKEDCEDCLDYAYNEIYRACGFGDGAQIKLVDCRLRFEHYDFPDDW